MNTVDRAFQERVGELQHYLETREVSPDTKSYLIAGLSPETGVFDEQAQLEQLESFCRNQDALWAEREQRAANIPAVLSSKTIIRDGSALTYYAGGTEGPAVALLNALAQGLEFLGRLIDQLADRYKIVIWEPRGTAFPPPPLKFAKI